VAAEDQRPKAESQKPIDWERVNRVLVVKLRSIGDTVLATPSLIALKRFLPDAQIDVLLEDWVAPVLDGSDSVDNVLIAGKGLAGRTQTARELKRRRYDVAFNLHGGTTATFFTAASRAKHRVGLATYQYSFLYNHLLSSPADFWDRDVMHSAEQQLALLGSVGVPVEDRPKSHLVVAPRALQSAEDKLSDSALGTPLSAFALLHPGTAFFTKRWPPRYFAHVAEYLNKRGIPSVAIGSRSESAIMQEVVDSASVAIATFDDFTLPEIAALASKAKLFVGNDSGIAHIAAAVNTPSVVIFGSSNHNHWRPWTDAPNEIVYEEFHCQPCPGYECKEFGEPRCILTVQPQKVFDAIDRVLSK
jgi:lipopolysaccharide heptosyltransferase II